jgi:hypothetical protein
MTATASLRETPEIAAARYVDEKQFWLKAANWM